jgi:P-type Cu+ transporter
MGPIIAGAAMSASSVTVVVTNANRLRLFRTSHKPTRDGANSDPKQQEERNWWKHFWSMQQDLP